MEYLGARGTLIYEKNLKAKISCQTPFKLLNTFKGSGFFHKICQSFEYLMAYRLILHLHPPTLQFYCVLDST